MSKTIKNEDTGEDEVVYTQAELDAQLAEKDKHIDQKLEEFKKGKTAQELKDAEINGTIEKIKEDAAKAVEIANTTVATARGKVVNFIASQIVGEDPELRKKLDESFAIIEEGRKAKGMDVSDDKVIQEMLISAAAMSGITVGTPPSPSFPLVNGMPPNFQKSPSDISEAEHEDFLKATGYEKPKPPAANA